MWLPSLDKRMVIANIADLRGRCFAFAAGVSHWFVGFSLFVYPLLLVRLESRRGVLTACVRHDQNCQCTDRSWNRCERDK